MTVKNRTILLTGASGGIGTCMARRLATEGARLLLTGRNHNRLEALASELGPGTRTIAADILAPEGRTRVAEAAREAGVDTVIHNAGGLEFALFGEQSDDTIEYMVRLNLLTPALLTRQLLPVLQARRAATLVFVGSTFGSIGHPGFVMYCAAKFGLRGFAEGLRRELSDTGITVHYLAPRATRTGINSPAVMALNESIGTAMDDPQAVADALVGLLARRRGTNLFMGWPEKLFVRINSLLPGMVDRAIVRKLGAVQRFAGSK